MKISNLKQIKLISCVIMLVSLFLVAAGIVSKNLVWKFICFLFFVTTLLIVINLRGIEIEKSGECFSLREMHPFIEKKYVPSKIEFPLSSINELNILEGFFACSIYIKIKSGYSEKKFRISLPLFTKKQIFNIRKLLRDKLV
ncbi:hypothetical protein [Chryseobacterium terrae]|uniref:PH domain-containing protein n=1 Tax=Chryseobacterium terrae TaxID=3163299 RepID=A0ABW8Y3M5_9FLAO